MDPFIVHTWQKYFVWTRLYHNHIIFTALVYGYISTRFNAFCIMYITLYRYMCEGTVGMIWKMYTYIQKTSYCALRNVIGTDDLDPFVSIAAQCLRKYILTHWGRVTHICVDNLTIIGSDYGLSPGRCLAIIWTNAINTWYIALFYKTPPCSTQQWPRENRMIFGKGTPYLALIGQL